MERGPKINRPTIEQNGIENSEASICRKYIDSSAPLQAAASLSRVGAEDIRRLFGVAQMSDSQHAN